MQTQKGAFKIQACRAKHDPHVTKQAGAHCMPSTSQPRAGKYKVNEEAHHLWFHPRALFLHRPRASTATAAVHHNNKTHFVFEITAAPSNSKQQNIHAFRFPNISSFQRTSRLCNTNQHSDSLMPHSPSKEAPRALSRPDVHASCLGVFRVYAAVGCCSHSVINGVDLEPSVSARDAKMTLNVSG